MTEARINPKLLNELCELGVNNGDVLLVHSSLNALRRGMEQPQTLTPRTVIDTLLAAVGGDGTLLMPALSYATVTETANLFDRQNTPCCVGAIPEAFRSEYPVLRSVHPTHSVCALGRLAEELTKRHQLDRTPVGEHSPFTLLPSVGGKILMLGCGLRPMTYMHGVEERFGVDYVMAEAPRLYRFADNGREWEAFYRHHNFAGYAQRYDRLAEVMEIRKGKTLGGESYLLCAAELEKKALEALKKNQHAFVDAAGEAD